MNLQSITQPIELNLLIGFSDFTGYTQFGEKNDATALFNLFSNYSEYVSNFIESRGGIVVKFIGDAFMSAFPEELASEGIIALLDLKEESTKWINKRGFKCNQIVKVHFGPVACGPFGAQKNFDAYGKTVNTAAMTKSHGFAITPQAFRRLAPEARKRFNTPHRSLIFLCLNRTEIDKQLLKLPSTQGFVLNTDP